MAIERTIPLMFKARVQASPDIIAQASKNEKGVFEKFTYARLYKDMIQFAAGLKKLGIRRADNVAFFSDNRREWLIADLAILSLGAIDVPRGKDSMAAELRFITSFAGCVFGIFENSRQLEKILENVSDVPLFKTAIVIETPDENTKQKASEAGIEVHSFEEIMNLCTDSYEAMQADIEKEIELTKTDDVATIIFTSGTTGTPKGVMLTHENYLAQLSVVGQVLCAKPGDMWLSVLPVWHSFERSVQYFALYFTNGIAYSKPVAAIMLSDLAAIKPQYICGVPRLWDGLGNAVIRAMRKKGGITYAMFKFFVSIGKKYQWARDLILNRVCHFKRTPRILELCIGILPFILLTPLNTLGNLLVFRKIRAKLGGRLNAAISGGGSLQKEVDEFFKAVGVNVLEGYGITEAAPVLSVRLERKPRSNCVGPVYPSVEIKIVAEQDGKIMSDEPLPAGQRGLILARSKNMRQIMKGYYNRQDLTDLVIDKDGWLNTGDIGIMTVDGDIKITGRAKDTIVLLGGENIEPMLIEQALCSSDYIESAMLVGQDKRYLGALIVPAKEFIQNYAAENSITFSAYEDLLETPEIQTLISSEIDRLVSADNGFRPCEKVFKFELIPESFQVGQELSAKQEMIRFKIAEKYKDRIAKLFVEE